MIFFCGILCFNWHRLNIFGVKCPLKSLKDRIKDEGILSFKNFPLSWTQSFNRQREFEKKLEAANYCGRVSFLTQPERSSLAAILANISGEKAEVFSKAKMRYRLSQIGDRPKSLIHHDAEYGFVGMIYLSRLPCHLDKVINGTHFFKHKRTSLIRRGGDFKTRIAAEILVKQEGKDLDKWDQIKTIPYERGKLFFFDSNLFHSPPLTMLKNGSEFNRETIEVFF